MPTKLKEAIDKGQWQKVMWESYPSEHNYFKFGDKVDEETFGLPTIWEHNALRNLPYFKEHSEKVAGSVWDLPKYRDKAIVLVGASPILSRQWEVLKKAVEDDNFIVACVNSAAQFLIDRDIIPDYVICIDGLYSTEWTLDVGEKAKDIECIFSPFVNTNALKEWPGKIRILPYTKGKKNSRVAKKVYNKWGRGIPGGGNAYNALFSVFIACTKATTFLFFGNELSYTKNYYAHNEDTQHKDLVYYMATDVNGEKVRTLSNLYTYKLWLERQTQFLASEYVADTFCFINCSGGILGVEGDGDLQPQVRQMTLDKAIEKVKRAFRFEKLSWEEKNEQMYETFYHKGTYGKDGGHKKWKYLVDVLLPPPNDVGKILDVGCGNGRGLRYSVDHGYDAYGIDIVDLPFYWEPMGIQNRCKKGFASHTGYLDEEFGLIVCTEVLEHIPMDGLDDVFKEMYRIGNDKFVFTMAMGTSFVLGTHIHLTIQPPQWWVDKLQEHGFIIKHTMFMMPKGQGRNRSSMFVYAVKDDKPYQTGEKQLTREGWTDEPWEFERDESFFYPEEVVNA